MANLQQTDYDNLVPQIVTHKRTGGSHSGQTVIGLEMGRGGCDHLGSPSVAGANLAWVRLCYGDGSSEMFVHDAGIETYLPGR
jgi:hypothetical protein